MWVLTGEREYFCGIHISVKSIRIVDEAASREQERLDPSTVRSSWSSDGLKRIINATSWDLHSMESTWVSVNPWRSTWSVCLMT
jgi:hypothetical protein